jgi:hypothetical protein
MSCKYNKRLYSVFVPLHFVSRRTKFFHKSWAVLQKHGASKTSEECDKVLVDKKFYKNFVADRKWSSQRKKWVFRRSKNKILLFLSSNSRSKVHYKAALVLNHNLCKKAKLNFPVSKYEALNLHGFYMEVLSCSGRHTNISMLNYMLYGNYASKLLPKGSSLRSNLSLSPWVNQTLLSFITALTGCKSIVQLYPFLHKDIDKASVFFYKRWVTRLYYYQKRLGHRFFMEEAMHIMHLSLSLHDVSLFGQWLSSLIKKISFWKTRSIFRYLTYLFRNFFIKEFGNMGCKGLKILLKGKISAAGNSRKRSIRLSFGNTSHSNLGTKCINYTSLVHTFTGVMCLNTYIFY